MLEWIEKEAKGREMLKLIFIFLVLNFAYNVIAFYSLSKMGVTFPMDTKKPKFGMFTWYLPVLIAFAAFVEECAFRAPLAIVALDERKTSMVLLMAVFLSVVFGYVHGGASFILIQGVSGFLYSILFLKCGGLKTKILKPLTASTTLHFLFNSTLALILFFHGAKTF